MATSIKQVLEQKGNNYLAVSPGDSVFSALALMAEHDVGCVLVTKSDCLVGIFTERDYARRVILKGRASRDVSVGELMTSNPCTITPSHTVDAVMQMMTENRFRHLPVVHQGKLMGIISIGDMVKTVVSQQQAIIRQLESYIAGDLATE